MGGVRAGTLAAVFAGASTWIADVLFVRVPGHGHDPWYWLGMAVFAAGIAAGSFVRRNDPRLPRYFDERGVTLGLRGFYALPRDDEGRRERF